MLHGKAFEDLKLALTSQPMLSIFDSKKETLLYTDASRTGVGGILLQDHENKEQVVAYYSRHTTCSEQNYHPFELEALAVVSCVKRFRHYLAGIHLKILIDCSVVRGALNKKELTQRIARWILELQEYSFDFCHGSGPQMAHVDALSRNPPKHSVCAVVIFLGDWLLAIQKVIRNLRRFKTL